jgi:hypothetical protein
MNVKKSGITPHSHIFNRWFLHRSFDLTKLCLIVPQAVSQCFMEVFCVTGTYAHDRLCPGLIRSRYLMKKDKRYFVFLERDLYAVAIDRVKRRWKIDRDLVSGHA